MSYLKDVDQSVWSAYLKQGLEDLQRILDSTRPVGQQYYQGKHVWNNRMLTEAQVLKELQSNSIFTTACGLVDEMLCEKEATVMDAKMNAIESWYHSVCEECGGRIRLSMSSVVESATVKERLFRELLFYASFIYNGKTEKHPLTLFTDRNQLLLDTLERSPSPFLQRITQQNTLQTILIITPELGKWSTVGGLGVMVDNLSRSLANQGQRVVVISPYYDRNRRGETDYLKRDGILYEKNLTVSMPSGETLDVGFHRGVLNGITYVFFHHAATFMRPYPSGSASFQMRCQVLMALAPLTYCAAEGLRPSLVITNDWPCGLVAAYARMRFTETPLRDATFFHIFHNLDDCYEGRIYPDGEETLSAIHGLPIHLLRDPYWKSNILNPSRCVLLSTDNWGTVSNVYQDDILHSSALSPLLRRFPQPFSSPNGVFVFEKTIRYATLTTHTHNTAKLFVQRKYFGVENLNIPLLVFVGRITEQKGVHLICEVAEELIVSRNRNIQIILGGIANESDPYGRYCINKINHLRTYYSDCFWANPHEFFTDGFVCNLAADYGLMPSLFEPCGIVQDEFFAAGTPVIAFNTGGLKETVHDWLAGEAHANGFLFSGYSYHDFMNTIRRALTVFANKSEYERLRETTSHTTIEVADQARNYISEFYRLRRCILPQVTIPFVYECDHAYRPRNVLLVGDFTEWNRHPVTMTKKESWRFESNLSLPPGNYHFKCFWQ